MKTILSAAMVLGLCGLAGARDEKANPVGTWQCEYEIGGQKRTSTRSRTNPPFTSSFGFPVAGCSRPILRPTFSPVHWGMLPECVQRRAEVEAFFSALCHSTCHRRRGS